MNEPERIQKVLSQLGLGSRREIERWIQEGEIKINGTVAKLGDKVSAQDQLMVKNKRVQLLQDKPSATRMLIYYKPVGEVCSRHDPIFKQTVFKRLPQITNGRWVQVGRLDLNTAGLLIFTNDGELAHQMMHPKFEMEREYAVRVYGQVSEAMISVLQQGVELEDGPAKFKQINYAGGEGLNSWYHVILTEGRHREVRRLWQSQGVEVSRLIRIRFGSIQLPRFLSQGKWIEMTKQEVDKFKRTLQMQSTTF